AFIERFAGDPPDVGRQMIHGHGHLPLHAGGRLPFGYAGDVPHTEHVVIALVAQGATVHFHPAFGGPVTRLPREWAVAYGSGRAHRGNNVDEVVGLVLCAIRCAERGDT